MTFTRKPVKNPVPNPEELLEAGWLRPFDYYFVCSLAHRSEERRESVLLGAAVVSRQTGLGHICVDLAELGGRMVTDTEGSDILPASWPEPSHWLEELRRSSIVGDGSGQHPLVMDRDGLLYLSRYWQYQCRFVHQIRRSARRLDMQIDLVRLRTAFDRWFPLQDDKNGDFQLRNEGILTQRLAALCVLRHGLSIISGGPGTGKTSTVVKILAVLFMFANAAGKAWPRVTMVAPTAKAAIRLRESIIDAIAAATSLASPDEAKLLKALPTATSTIHKALGWQPRTPTRFRHNAENPLATDIVVIDETSMVDLALITKMLEAVPHTARTILLGDRDQLASVEAGAIMADLCAEISPHKRYSSAYRDEIKNVIGVEWKSDDTKEPAKNSELGNCVVHLSYSFRFGTTSGIGSLARAVNEGNAGKSLTLLQDSHRQDISWRDYTTVDELNVLLQPHIHEMGISCESVIEPEEKFAIFQRNRILCGHRRGPDGEDAINTRIEKRIRSRMKRDQSNAWYDGRPIMILVNDYQRQLFNGDIGVIFQDNQKRLMTFFPNPEGGFRSISPTRLPAHKTVYAMTVHKSQGSEYDNVVLILPMRPSPVITRELLYTGITRARKSVTIYAPRYVLLHAIATPVQRTSGLKRQLWADDSGETC